MHDCDMGAGAALHVTNGDIVVELLSRTGFADRALAWLDVLHEGPVPDAPADELRRIRSEFLAGAGPQQRASVDRRLTACDEALVANRGGDYVLWFEADLFCQLQLTQVLARLGELGVAPDRITLVSVGEHPGIAHFGGLGELSPAQLAGLLDTAASPLSEDALRLASSAWKALRSPDPSALAAVAASRSGELRFIGEAYGRLSQEYPWTRNGLSLTERRILASTADCDTAADVFVRTGQLEWRPHLGDTWSYATMRRLAQAPTPLLEIAPAGRDVLADSVVRLTDAGQRVLEGELDHVVVNGVDRWVGGVHLIGHDVPWRWHESRESLVSTA